MVSATVSASWALAIVRVGSVTIRLTPAGHTSVCSGRRSITPVIPILRRVRTSSARSGFDDTKTSGPGCTSAAGAKILRVLPVRVGALTRM